MFQRPTIRGAATAPHGPPLRLAENWEAEAIMTLNTVVLLGSVRADRQGIKAARFIIRKLEARGHRVALVDPLEKRLPLLRAMRWNMIILLQKAEVDRSVEQEGRLFESARHQSCSTMLSNELCTFMSPL